MNRFNDDSEGNQNLEFDENSDQKSFQFYDDTDQNFNLVDDSDLQQQDDIIHLNEQHFQDKEKQNFQTKTKCQESCVYNRKILQNLVEESLKEKYERYFFFYFAKPINEILSNSPVHHVVLFKEYLFIDDNSEYAKRFYFEHETKQRIDQLASFYKKVYPPIRPNYFGSVKAFNDIIQQNKYNFNQNFYKQIKNNQLSTSDCNNFKQDELHQEKDQSIYGYQLDIQSDSNFTESQQHQNPNSLSSNNLNSFQHEQQYNNIQNNQGQNNMQTQIKVNHQQSNYERDEVQLNKQRNNQQKLPVMKLQLKDQKHSFNDQSDQSLNNKLMQLEEEDAKTDNQIKDQDFQDEALIDKKQNQCYIKNGLSQSQQQLKNEYPTDKPKFYQLNQFSNQNQARDLASSQNQKDRIENQDKIEDNQNRVNYNYFKNIQNKSKQQQHIQKNEEEKDNKQFNNDNDNNNNDNDNQCEEQDDFEDMLNILHSQNLKKMQNQFENIQNIEFEGQNDFSLHSDEFMDQGNFRFENQKDGASCDNQKFYEKYLDKQENLLQIETDQLYPQENYEHQQREQFYSNLKQMIVKKSSSFQSEVEYQDDQKDYLSSQRSEEDYYSNSIFGENQFMKELDQYELERSFETDTFDVYNPQFSSDEGSRPQMHSLLQEEQRLFKQVCDFQDIDDLMERYAIGEERYEFVCRCAEFAQNKQNNSNKLFEQQEKVYFQRMENAKEQRNTLKQECNSHRSKNSGNNSNINLQQLMGQIENGQIQKTASTSLSKLKNQSSTPSNQNNNPSSQSMKSSHHHQTLQPEDYQFQTLQQSLQQQIQQQQIYNHQNNGQQKQKSPIKKQQNTEQQKSITDSSPIMDRNYEKDFIELSPILEQKSQNFNEMLQVQIQNQMMIKQKLERQKGDNFNNKITEQNQQYFTNCDSKNEANILYKQNQLIQQSQPSSKLLINQLQQTQFNKNIQNPNVSLTNSKNINNTSNTNNNNNNNNNSKIDQNSQIYQSNMQLQQQQTKPFYNNTQKKLASQLAFQNNLLSQQNQSSNQQPKFFKQNEFNMNNNQQQNASLQQGVSNQGIDSSPLMAANLIKQGQRSNEFGNTKKTQKKLNQNEQQNISSQNSVQQSSKPKINSNNCISQPQNNFHVIPLQSIHQISGAASNNQQQNINQSKNNLINKSNNFSQQNIKNNLSKGHNPSPQQQLNILSLNQQNFNEKSQSYKAYNQISSQYSNNQSKIDLKNTTSSLIASTTSSQKGLSNQCQNQLVTSQPNPSNSSKSRAKMHGKEQRNLNHNNYGSCSLSNIKKQNISNQTECQALCLQTNSLVKSHHIPSQTEQFQLENVQQYQSPSELNNLVHNKNNPSNQMMGEKKNNEQSLIISQQQRLEQQHYQYTSPPQKRQHDNKSMSLLGANKLANKSISHSTNLFQKDEGGVRTSQAQQSTSKIRDSSKKSSDIMQVLGSAVTGENNQNITLTKQASKENVTLKSDYNNKMNSILAQNQNNKLRALNIEVQRRISLKHQKIKENNLFLGTHKNVSIDRDSIPSTSQDGQIQSRFDQFNISRKQNSLKMNQKRFPHLNNSVGDPSSIDKKQDISNAVSILDSNRDMQYSNNPHHNQIVQQLLALNQINPPITDQGFKKSSQNFLHAGSKNNNQNIIESATKLAANIYSQSSHKNIKNIQNHIINSGSSQVINSCNYSRSFVQTTNNNPSNNLNQCLTSQQNSRINSQEKGFSRLNKNKSLDENLKKKNSQSNILNHSNAQQIESNSTMQRQQQFNSLSNSLPNKKLKQHYYPLSNTSSQYQGHAQTASHPIFMSPQFKNQNSTFQNSDQFQLDNSNAYNKSATQNTAQTISYCSQKQNQQLFNTDTTQISQMTLQNKNRNKQNILPFNSQISQSLQQSLQSSQQYKQTASNSQNQFDEVLMIDNPISSPRFKKIKSIDKIFNQHEQQQLQQNVNENVSPSKSSTPSQNNTSNQQYIATFSNLNEKEKQNSGVKNNSKQSQKKQLFHYNSNTNLNLKKNNFIKQQEALRNSQQQQQFSIGDGLSQNSSYGFLTSRSMKKQLKDGQAQQKMTVQESPYNMDNIKETSKSLQQQQQQLQQSLNLVQNSKQNNSNNNNNNNSSNNNLIKVKQNQLNQKQLFNQIENYEDVIASSRQEYTNKINQPNNFFTQNVQGNSEYRNQDQEYGQLLVQQQVQQQQQNQNSNQVIINLQIQQYPSSYINESLFQGTQINLRNQQQMNILNQNSDFNQYNIHPNQYQQQINENYSKIKNDLKQNALDIIKTQKRKK